MAIYVPRARRRRNLILVGVAGLVVGLVGGGVVGRASAPTVEDLTHRRVDAGNQCGEYPLGSWGSEDRDYHIQVEIEPAARFVT